MNKKILVPIDGSEHALKALAFALDMAKAYNDELILLNVQPTLETYNTKRFFSKEDIAEYQQQQAQEAFAAAISLIEKEGAGIPYTTKLRLGIPSIQICNEATDAKVRCIVMGSRGMGPVVGKVLGSVSYGVVHQAPCPLMIVPA